jgi:hypothetical protein
MNQTLAQSTTGIAGTGATVWLMEVNPWLAFISGILTITLTSIALYQKLKK